MRICFSACFSRIAVIFVILVLLLLAVPASAQYHLTVAPRVSYGAFRMQDMKDMQQELTKYNGGFNRITEQFPPAFLPGFTIGYHFDNRYTMGLLLETGVVKGQVITTDPAMVFVVDHRIRYRSAGIFGQVREQLGQVEFFAGLEAAYFTNKMEWQEVVEEERKLIAYISPGMGVRPFAGIGLALNRFRPSLSIGYQLYKPHPFQLYIPRSNLYGFALLVNGKPAGPDWSGLRANLSVGMLLFKK